MWTLGFSLTLGSRGRHHSKFLKAGRTSPLSHGETLNTVTFLPGPPHTWGVGGGRVAGWTASEALLGDIRDEERSLATWLVNAQD